MVSFGGSIEVKRYSISDLLQEVVHCKTAPSNNKCYPEGESCQVGGTLLDGEITPYYMKDGDSAPRRLGEKIGNFTLSGVIEENGWVLAFRYEADDRLPDGDSQFKGSDSTCRLPLEYIRGKMDGSFARYLHLKAVLNQTHSKVILEGQVKNCSPRLFLPRGMAVEISRQTETLRTVHRFVNDPQYTFSLLQDSPINR